MGSALVVEVGRVPEVASGDRQSLSDADLALCERLARGRSGYARATGIPDERTAPQGGFEVDFLGLRAELAFARWAGVDFGPSRRLGGDGGGWDFVVGLVRVSVKGRFRGTHMTVPARQWPPRADVYVLLEPAGEREMRFVGWCWGATLALHAEEKGEGRRWLHERHLWGMDVPIAGIRQDMAWKTRV